MYARKSSIVTPRPSAHGSEISSLKLITHLLRHDQIVEISVGAFRREPDDGAAGAAPALRADSCGELSGTVDVVIDEDDQPLDAGEDGERAEFAAAQCGPGRLQRCPAVGNPG